MGQHYGMFSSRVMNNLLHMERDVFVRCLTSTRKIDQMHNNIFTMGINEISWSQKGKQ
jgi:hypothetical protein